LNFEIVKGLFQIVEEPISSCEDKHLWIFDALGYGDLEDAIDCAKIFRLDGHLLLDIIARDIAIVPAPMFVFEKCTMYR